MTKETEIPASSSDQQDQAPQPENQTEEQDTQSASQADPEPSPEPRTHPTSAYGQSEAYPGQRTDGLRNTMEWYAAQQDFNLGVHQATSDIRREMMELMAQRAAQQQTTQGGPSAERQPTTSPEPQRQPTTSPEPQRQQDQSQEVWQRGSSGRMEKTAPKKP